MTEAKTEAKKVAPVIENGMVVVEMVSSTKETVKDKVVYVEVGRNKIYIPLLATLGIMVEPKSFDAEGLPEYGTDPLDYIFGAVLASVKADARNKVDNKTGKLKDGLKIAETLEELFATGTRNGEALANAREMLKDFRKFLSGTGKTENLQAYIAQLASNKVALGFAPQAWKQGVLDMVTAFAATLDEEKAGKYNRSLLSIEEVAGKSDTDTMLAELQAQG